MKFNTKLKAQKIRNYGGATAYKITPELELYSAVVTASLANKFYESDVARLERIRKLIGEVSAEFVAKLAIYTREKMYLRSVPMVLAVELAKIHRGNAFTKQTVARVIQRADEITELLAYYQFANDRKSTKKLNKLAKQVQKGVAAAFNKFDEYQFAKYNRAGEVSLKDALFLTHPKPKDEAQQVIFNKIVNDNLQVPYTWEVELSRLGQTQFETEGAKVKAFSAKWEELIASGKLGYMALMRNLRNILEVGVGAKSIEKVASILSDPNKVRRSKQLPFRYLAAYREVEQLGSSYVSYILDALEAAIQVSAENIQGYDLATKVLIASDVSGSMYSAISAKSKIRCYDIGLVLSMLMKSKSKNVITGIFGDSWMEVNLPSRGILQNTMKLNSLEGKVGYSTNGYLVIDELINSKRKLDKVLFFTDMQMWNSNGGNSSFQKSWHRYKKSVAPNAKLYLFDLQGYGQVPLRMDANDVYLIAGWSDKIFNILAAIENGSNAVEEINNIDL
ncbi:MAG: TROVE domain-containing protein [Flammeovirgaceae bacterium]